MIKVILILMYFYAVWYLMTNLMEYANNKQDKEKEHAKTR